MSFIEKYNNRKTYDWILAIWIAFVFLQSLPFKFTGSPETVHIFSTIGEWINGNFLSFAGDAFAAYGGVGVGIVELIAAILILMPRTRVWGAMIAFIVITGAIFFHLFTPLGIVVDHGVGATLFVMAVTVWIASLILIYLHKKQFMRIVGK